ncbi:DUF4174 domain-containing protein [Leucothrix arctica]|uniref:DUF4174 domain-containing protein n=1 Tax=Leucothrix arctica TaxID=1481894 RepID=A0A317C3R4_9GAMM|nr:DUF4174 domain-containing protein [Leucothrix arctica]PWQ93228.1 hypothetical protein DKT75_21310 [Leucothrix arctica]
MRYLWIVYFMFLPMTLQATGQSVTQALGEFAWEKRQIIVFTPAADDSRLTRFKTIQTEFAEDFAERFLQTWIIEADGKVLLEGKQDSRLQADSFYQHFNVQKDEFRVVLIGYDQGEKLRQAVFNIDELLGEIDQMSMRQQEMRSQ